jgi:lipid-binding SYLF domain-containing protein
MRKQIIAISFSSLVLSSMAPATHAADRSKLNRDATTALQDLYAKNEVARLLGPKARAILVFPSIVKAGFIVGGQMGSGVLLQNEAPAGYYRSVAGSYGLQAGAQAFGYALFFMNQEALSYLDRSGGWEVGVGPSIVIIESGAAKSVTNATLTEDIYAFIFDQKGLMAGIGIQGSKITKLED